MKKPKFTTTFSSTLIPVVSEEKDRFLALASLDKIQKFIPKVDTKENFDLLPIAFNACNVNRANRNGDVIDTETALAIYNTFINKPINIEHNRQKVIGCILVAGFSEFGTDKPLTLDDVKDSKDPFNITLGGVIWRVVNGDIADTIESSGDPASENYLAISASWELGFSDYQLIVTEGEDKNIKGGQIISDAAEVLKLENNLKCYGGTGKMEAKSVYRMPSKDVLAIGIGITESPAAEVKGIASNQPEEPEAKETLAETLKSVVLKTIIEQRQVNNLEVSAKTTSQPENNNVNENSVIMKITDIKDITDESIKVMKASAVCDFLSEKIQEANVAFIAEKAAKDKVAQDSLAALEDLKVTKEELAKVQKALEEISAKNAEKEKLDTFNLRMSNFDNAYDLTDEDRGILASEIKEMNEESFAKYEKSIAVFMKEKNKNFKKEKADKAAKEGKDKEKEKESKASEDSQKTVDTALDQSKVTTPNVPATSTATQTLKEKFASAFAPENFIVKR
jgi:hypothetical protein